MLGNARSVEGPALLGDIQTLIQTRHMKKTIACLLTLALHLGAVANINVVTNPASSITADSATISMTLQDADESSFFSVGFDIGITSGNLLFPIDFGVDRTDAEYFSAGTGAETFFFDIGAGEFVPSPTLTFDLVGLLPNTTYFFQGVAVNTNTTIATTGAELSFTTVPEPSVAAALLGLGALAFVVICRRRAASAKSFIRLLRSAGNRLRSVPGFFVPGGPHRRPWQLASRPTSH